MRDMLTDFAVWTGFGLGLGFGIAAGFVLANELAGLIARMLA